MRKKISDPLYLGVIAGIACTAVKEPLARFCIKRGWAPYDGIQKGAGLVLEPYEIPTRKGTAVGILVDSIMGSFAGIFMSILHTRGYKITPLKGAFCGLGIWASWYGALGRHSSYGRTTPNGALVSAGWHVIYGAVAGTVISLLGEHNATSVNTEKSDLREVNYDRLPIDSPVDQDHYIAGLRH